MMSLNLTNANASLSPPAIRNSNAASVPSASFLRKQSCSRFGPSLAECKPRMSPVVAVWWVSGSRVKTRGQCYSLDHDWPSYIRLACLLDRDWPSSSRLVCPQHRWAQTDRGFWKSTGKYTSTSPGHLPHWPCNGPKLSNSLQSGTQQMESTH